MVPCLRIKVRFLRSIPSLHKCLWMAMDWHTYKEGCFWFLPSDTLLNMTTLLVYSADHGMYVYTPTHIQWFMSKKDGELRANKLADRKQATSQQVKTKKENLLVSSYSTLRKNRRRFGEMKKLSRNSGNSSKVLRKQRSRIATQTDQNRC